MSTINQNRFFLLIIILTFTACSKRTPPQAIYTKITPEQINLSTAKLQPHELRYQKLGGTMNYSMSKEEVYGKVLWKVEIRFNSEQDSKPDTMWLDENTLAFRRRLLTMPDYTIDVNYENGHFGGHLIPSDNSKYTRVDYDKTYPHDAFEPAIINYAIAALPLKIGYTASIPVLDLNNGSKLFWSNIKVLAEETITIDGVSYETWKVESDGIRKKVIWIDKQNIFAIKMETSGNAGAWQVVPSSIKMN